MLVVEFLAEGPLREFGEDMMNMLLYGEEKGTFEEMK